MGVLYTERQLCKHRRNTYLNALEKRFGWLAEKPQPGKPRADVAEVYFSFPQGQNVIF